MVYDLHTLQNRFDPGSTKGECLSPFFKLPDLSRVCKVPTLGERCHSIESREWGQTDHLSSRSLEGWILFSLRPSSIAKHSKKVKPPYACRPRFYLHGNTIASLQTTVPCLLPYLEREGVNAVAFPDDGAAKRFKHMFDADRYAIIVCGKVRDGDKRVVTVQDGDATGRRVIVIDDLVQTGGTLYECGAKLLELGAASVSAFVAHGVFPRDAWRRFARGGDRDVFSKFYVTNSIPTTTDRCVSAASCFFFARRWRTGFARALLIRHRRDSSQ